MCFSVFIIFFILHFLVHILDKALLSDFGRYFLQSDAQFNSLTDVHSLVEKGYIIDSLAASRNSKPQIQPHRANCTIQAMAATDKVFIAALLLMAILSISHRGKSVC